MHGHVNNFFGIVPNMKKKKGLRQAEAYLFVLFWKIACVDWSEKSPLQLRLVDSLFHQEKRLFLPNFHPYAQLSWQQRAVVTYKGIIDALLIRCLSFL